MSEPAAPEAPQPEHVGHFAHWFALHVAPDVSDIRVKSENAAHAAGKVAGLGLHLQVIAGAVAELAKAAPGLPPGRAEEVAVAAGEVARIAAELGALGM